MGLFVAENSVLFLPEVDRQNSYETIVCNWQKDRVLKVKKEGYQILEFICQNPGVSSLAVVAEFEKQGQPAPAILKFLEQMKAEKILGENSER